MVDDFPSIRALLKGICKGLGFVKIDEAESGPECLQMIRQAHSRGEGYDIVFLDWNMPNCTGLEVLKEMRRDASISHVPVVMVTAERTSEQVLEAVRSGVTAYIVKPFNVVEVKNKIERVLKTAI